MLRPRGSGDSDLEHLWGEGRAWFCLRIPGGWDKQGLRGTPVLTALPHTGCPEEDLAYTHQGSGPGACPGPFHPPGRWGALPTSLPRTTSPGAAGSDVVHLLSSGQAPPEGPTCRLWHLQS